MIDSTISSLPTQRVTKELTGRWIRQRGSAEWTADSSRAGWIRSVHSFITTFKTGMRLKTYEFSPSRRIFSLLRLDQVDQGWLKPSKVKLQIRGRGLLYSCGWEVNQNLPRVLSVQVPYWYPKTLVLSLHTRMDHLLRCHTRPAKISSCTLSKANCNSGIFWLFCLCQVI